jgi:hypothetical protein
VEFGGGNGTGARPQPNSQDTPTKHYALKKRLASDGGPPREAPGKATFLEFLPQRASGLSVCTIEMENAQGGKMRIQLQGLGAPDPSALSNNFWRVGS